MISLFSLYAQMPNMDGLEATRRVRELEESCGREAAGPGPAVVILGLSAGAMKCDTERGLAAGMTGYLTKPVNYKILMSTLQQHLQANAEPTSQGS